MSCGGEGQVFQCRFKNLQVLIERGLMPQGSLDCAIVGHAASFWNKVLVGYLFGADQIRELLRTRFLRCLLHDNIIALAMIWYRAPRLLLKMLIKCTADPPGALDVGGRLLGHCRKRLSPIDLRLLCLRRSSYRIYDLMINHISLQSLCLPYNHI